MPLHKALFFETSPAPAKYALAGSAAAPDEVRLPLVGLRRGSKAASGRCRAGRGRAVG